MIVFLAIERYPANEVPIWGDILLGVLFPRVLILIYIYQNMGYENVWFIAHMAALLLSYFGGGRSYSRRRRRKRED